jgi:transcriptional regulator with XRE-family HTH domain
MLPGIRLPGAGSRIPGGIIEVFGEGSGERPFYKKVLPDSSSFDCEVARGASVGASEVDVGAKIRSFRKNRGLSLIEMASRTGIAASNLSSIELNKSSPTLSTLIKIAGAYGMKVGEFVDGVLYNKAILRREGEGEREACCDPAVAIFKLTGEIFLNRIDARLVELGPDQGQIQVGLPGTDRLLYCLEGEARVTVDAETYLLRAGDMLYLLPEAAATVEQTGEGPTRILVVNNKS